MTLNHLSNPLADRTGGGTKVNFASAEEILPATVEKRSQSRSVKDVILALMKIEFTSQVFKEGRMFVAHSPELDVSSCATTERKALANLQEAVRLFLEEAERKGSLKQILKEAGFSRRQQTLVGPKLIHTKRITMPLTLAHAQA